MIPLPFKADWIAGALIAGAIAVAAATAWAWRYQQGKTAGQAEVQALWDADKLRRSEAHLKAVTALVAERNAQQQRADHAEQKLLDQQADSARVVAGLRAHAERLRSAIEQFAAGGGDAAADDLTACRARAIALGGLLDGALQDGAACAERGERDAAIARALHEAWPVSAVASGAAP